MRERSILSKKKQQPKCVCFVCALVYEREMSDEIWTDNNSNANSKQLFVYKYV